MKQTTRVRAVLARQYGVITTPQALACGLIRGDVRGLVESGTWRRLGRGLFVLSGSPPSFEQKVLGCCLAGGPNAVASHWTAARLLAVGGPVSLTRPVEITVGPTSSIAGARQLGAKVHRSNDLDKHDRVKVARIPVTHPARLLLDLGGELSRRALEGLVDDVLHRYPAISPHAVLDRVGKRPGGPALRNALQPWLTGPRPDSPPEMELFRRLSELAGPDLGQPERQYPVTDPETGRLLGRVDLAYPDRKLAIEYNGRRYHNARTAAHDGQRKVQIVEAGWTVEDTGLMS